MLTSAASALTFFLKLSFQLSFISQGPQFKFSYFCRLGSYQERSVSRLVIALPSPDELETDQNPVPTICTNSECCTFYMGAETLPQLCGKYRIFSVKYFYKVFSKTQNCSSFLCRQQQLFFHIYDPYVTETRAHLSTLYIFICAILCVFSGLVVKK